MPRQVIKVTGQNPGNDPDASLRKLFQKPEEGGIKKKKKKPSPSNASAGAMSGDELLEKFKKMFS